MSVPKFNRVIITNGSTTYRNEDVYSDAKLHQLVTRVIVALNDDQLIKEINDKEVTLYVKVNSDFSEIEKQGLIDASSDLNFRFFKI